MILLHVIRIALLAGAMLGVGPRIATGQVFDLSGTWTGSITCKAATAGVKEKITLTPAVTISQIDNRVGVRVDLGSGGVEHYTGLANPDEKKPLTKGEIALIHCGSDDAPGADPSFDEIGRFVAATKEAPVAKASLKGISVFARPESIGTCTWKWTRTALGNPGVPVGCLP